MHRHRIAFVTIGQAPRDDIVPELLDLLGWGEGDAGIQQFGALDGLSPAEIAAALEPRERKLYSRLADGSHAVIGAGLVTSRLEPLMRRLDEDGFDLIVLITTGVFQPFRLRTKLVDGQEAVDAWVGALLMTGCELGVIYPLPQQHRPFAHGALIGAAQLADATGEPESLDEAASRLSRAGLILMNSVGYTEEMGRRVAAASGRPVVTARRILAGAIRLFAGRPALRPAAPDSPAALLNWLPGVVSLTRRERDVLEAALDGQGNKAVGRTLGISHRTVEIHRARALAKLHAASPGELIRRALSTRSE